jgi:hypothetical protein
LTHILEKKLRMRDGRKKSLHEANQIRSESCQEKDKPLGEMADKHARQQA